MLLTKQQKFLLAALEKLGCAEQRLLAALLQKTFAFSSIDDAVRVTNACVRQMQMGAQAVRKKINNETERIKSERQAEEEKERERQQIFGPLEKVKAAIRNRRKRKGGKHSIPALAAPAEEQQFGNTDEIAAESADAVDETEDYAGLEDVEPEFSQQDAPVQRDGADDDGEYPGIRL